MVVRSGAASAPLRARALTCAGYLARGQRDFAGYAACYESALTLYREIGDQIGVAHALTHLGQMAGDQGDLERMMIGAPLAPADQAILEDPGVVAARAALGEEAFAGACGGGRAIPLEEIIADAMEAEPT
jgi:hypothetical protein